jgi:hypothetical protein
MHPRTRHLLAPLLAIPLAGGAAPPDAPPAGDAAKLEHFEKKVRPILHERCLECHSAEKKIKGGLSLETGALTLKGGDTGPAVLPGDPDKSLLIEAVRYANHDLQMPPKGRLSDSEVRALEEWVRMGAPDPRTTAAQSKPVRAIDVEKGRSFWSFAPLQAAPGTALQETPVTLDGFVRDALQKAGLSMSPSADKRTLIRRATFDLTGLPPTPHEVDVFLADSSPEAFERVVERLLASPHYGERWGRHWLDVARYADSNGMDENIAFGNAWRYRDYVVDSFNNDKPFDRFIIEQIAGDLLPASKDTVTATGFLSLGARVLAEPDLQKLEMDIIDEQIDTVGKAFLGMTLGCVRCHDHKFDPVSQEDYYAMAAIFRSTRSLSSEKMGAIKFWHEHSTATAEQLEEHKKHQDTLKAKKAEVAAYTEKCRASARARAQERAADYLVAAAGLPADPAQTQAESAAKPAGLNAAILLACRKHLAAQSADPVFVRWHALAAGGRTEEIRAHYTPLFNQALAAKKGAEYEALTSAKGLLALPAKNAELLDKEQLAKIESLNQESARIEAAAPELPGVMSVADKEVVKTIKVHLRGNYLTLGKAVERGFPEVMRTSLTKPIFPAKQSGRLELAKWIASGEHPLTARVIVNRVWRWHFGRGLVSTTDNFGILGARPSHPELLDWLARGFVENGWSIKDLHRLIMSSAAYQQSSFPAPPAPGRPDPQDLDPENKLLWRANMRRLEAEEIRDAMLACSGWLDRSIGGKTIPRRNREFVFNHTSKDATTYESARRALYLPIIRNHLCDIFEQFDYPDPTSPTGSRNSTVVAPQALIMMNAPVVARCGRELASALARIADEPARIEAAYQILYARSPSPGELGSAARLLRDFESSADPALAWPLFCQTLFAANEFIYLR